MELRHDPAPLSVWDEANWRQVADAWTKALTSERIAEISHWRDERLAALVARSQRAATCAQ